MTTTRPCVAYTLPAALLLMAPFDIPLHWRWIFISCRSSDARHPEHDARYDPTHVEPLYGDARRGP